MQVQLLMRIQCFKTFRLTRNTGGYSAFTGNSQDIRVSDTARYILCCKQTFTTTNSARTGVSVSSASNTKLLAFTTTTTTDVASTHTITAQGGLQVLIGVL